MRGQRLDQFANEDYHARKAVSGILEPHDGGRATTLNISLLNLWAHAPFLHNNSVGPELCGWGGDKANPYELYRSSYVDTRQPGNPPLAQDRQPACRAYDPSVDGRFKLYVASMNDLLNPSQRIPKATKVDQDIVLDIGPRIFDGKEEKRLVGFTVRCRPAPPRQRRQLPPQGFIVDLIRAKLKRRSSKSASPPCFPQPRPEACGRNAGHRQGHRLRPRPPGRGGEGGARPHPGAWQVYSSCSAEIENDGHRFGEDLSHADKNALIAFLATL